jgi:hypothetical protein
LPEDGVPIASSSSGPPATRLKRDEQPSSKVVGPSWINQRYSISSKRRDEREHEQKYVKL